ncbi:SLC13 family permease [Pseudomonas sp. RIT-PI-AD]|uniref:SLC13 family permease n=1 Tax=Pseudomonas sp. RIT-PI-AD TaxID=3035294 RepID=UPI0021DA776E|nr:SLC13 family permease [Pseudomonas sp. RIT-PI-AD]
MDVSLLLTAGLVAATIGLWATARLPEYLTALLFFTLAMVLKVAPAALIFSGFASSAFWLVLSGYVIGIAIRKTGLADRCARWLAPGLSGSYPRLVFGVIGLTYALAFVMPSNMGRIALLMPIVLALADRTGLGEGRPGRIGLGLAVGFGTFQLSASILPANVPNLVMAGAIESSYGLHLAYLPYLLLHLPVLGLLKGVALGACVCGLFRDRLEGRVEAEAAQPLSADEKRLALLLAVTLGLWFTDALHGISPAWVGLGAACICLLPRIGFVSGEEFGKEVNHRTALYVAAILGLAALVAQSGLGEAIGQALLHVLPLGAIGPLGSFAAITGVAVLLGFVVTANGVPALFTPLAHSLASASGLPLLSVLMIQVIGFSTPLLPYQASPIVVAMGMGRIPFAAALRLSLVLAGVTFLVLLPLDYLWFRLMGQL